MFLTKITTEYSKLLKTKVAPNDQRTCLEPESESMLLKLLREPMREPMQELRDQETMSGRLCWMKIYLGHLLHTPMLITMSEMGFFFFNKSVQ